MAKFAIIYPNERKITSVDVEDYREAMKIASLDEVDFGTVAKWQDGRSLNIIVYELGLIDGKDEGYFSIAKRLYRGNAILFVADEEGKTIEIYPQLLVHFMDECKDFLWLDTIANAEAAIERGDVIRPQSSINGEVFWSWPDRR